MTDDDIRYVLSSYAATTPELDPRAGLAERFARRDRARRAAVAGVACLAAVVAGTGVAAVTRGRGGAGLVVATDPTPTETPYATGDPSPSPTDEPSPSPTDEPSLSASTSPSEAPPASPTASPTTTPPALDYSGVAVGKHGLRLRIEMVEPRPKTGTYVALRVIATDDDGTPRAYEPGWGDGWNQPNHRPVEEPQPCPPQPSPGVEYPGRYEDEWTHAWRLDGTYVIEVSAESSVGCSDRPRDHVTAYLRVTVHEGRIVSNGPLEPTGRVYDPWRDDSYDDPGVVHIGGQFTDDDGYVGSVTIDWGDGSEPTTLTQDDACSDGDGQHYPVWTAIRPDDVEHQYAAGEYEITVTITSSGCDGKDEQVGYATTAVAITEDGRLAGPRGR